MFLHHCHHCGRRELRGPRSLSTDEHGTFVAACRACGAVSPVLGDRPAPTAPAVPTPIADRPVHTAA